jgi:hypothetical protein
VAFLLSLPQLTRIYLFLGVHLISAAFVILARPFQSAKDNVNEIINESIYLILVLSLIYLKNEAAWKGAFKYVFMALIILCSLTEALIFFIAFIIIVVIK